MQKLDNLSTNYSYNNNNNNNNNNNDEQLLSNKLKLYIAIVVIVTLAIIISIYIDYAFMNIMKPMQQGTDASYIGPQIIKETVTYQVSNYADLKHALHKHPLWFIEFFFPFLSKISNINFIYDKCEVHCLVCDIIDIWKNTTFSEALQNILYSDHFNLFRVYVCYYPLFLAFMLLKIVKIMYTKKSKDRLSNVTLFTSLPFSEYINTYIKEKVLNYYKNLSFLEKLGLIYKYKWILTFKGKILLICRSILEYINILPQQTIWIFVYICQHYWDNIKSWYIIQCISYILKTICPSYYLHNSTYYIRGLMRYTDTCILDAMSPLFLLNGAFVELRVFKLYLLIEAVTRLILFIDQKIFKGKLTSQLNKHYYYSCLVYKLAIIIMFIFMSNYIVYINILAGDLTQISLLDLNTVILINIFNILKIYYFFFCKKIEF